MLEKHKGEKVHWPHEVAECLISDALEGGLALVWVSYLSESRVVVPRDRAAITIDFVLLRAGCSSFHQNTGPISG